MNAMHFWSMKLFCYDIMQIFPRCITVAKTFSCEKLNYTYKIILTFVRKISHKMLTTLE